MKRRGGQQARFTLLCMQSLHAEQVSKRICTSIKPPQSRVPRPLPLKNRRGEGSGDTGQNFGLCCRRCILDSWTTNQMSQAALSHDRSHSAS
jgi:hypothetical protein